MLKQNYKQLLWIWMEWLVGKSTLLKHSIPFKASIQILFIEIAVRRPTQLLFENSSRSTLRSLSSFSQKSDQQNWAWKTAFAKRSKQRHICQGPATLKNKNPRKTQAKIPSYRRQDTAKQLLKFELLETQNRARNGGQAAKINIAKLRRMHVTFPHHQTTRTTRITATAISLPWRERERSTGVP